MSKEKPDDLIKKYLAAESTLEEEDQLFNTESSDIEAWANYVRKRKKKAPADLNSTIWASIQRKKQRKQRFIAGISTIAASLVLLAVVFMNNKNSREMDYAEKEVLLNEALSLFPEEENTTTDQSVIYEDDIVIIYSASK